VCGAKRRPKRPAAFVVNLAVRDTREGRGRTSGRILGGGGNDKLYGGRAMQAA
jgi:hypothetical protein